MGWTRRNDSRRRGTSALLLALAMGVPVAVGTSGSAGAQADPAIPDDGLPPVVIAGSPVVSERTEILGAGVSGLVDRSIDTFPNTQAHVLAFAELNDVIYVGGKFTQVDAAAGGSSPQSFLAAFDRDTGNWIPMFAPDLDGAVWDLKILDSGMLVVAGQFSNVNGVPNTAAIAFLDPQSGEVITDTEIGIRLTGSDRRPLVRAMDIEGQYLYLVGNFTRLTGTDGVERQVNQIGRVDLNTGRIDTNFRPQPDGILFDVDADGDRVYFVGNFFNVNGEFHPGLGVVSSANAELIPGLQPFVRTNSRSYQQAIRSLDDEVWMVGSEHNRQVYRATDYGLIRSWVSDPFGDGQAVTELNGIVYTGSHAVNRGSPTNLYRNAIRWPNPVANTDGAPPGVPAIAPIKYMGAFDTSINEQVDWVPQIGSNGGEGSWELFVDSTDCLWTGGDFTRGSFDGNTPRFVRGFAKFCAVDQTPPEPPSSPTAEVVGNGVNLAWDASPGDDRPGQVRYELLKNDDVFASFISTLTFRDPDGTPDDRYFVRAMDVAGNRSATTRVFTANEGPDTSRPTQPTDLAADIASLDDDDILDDVVLTWTASTDNVGVAEYIVYRNNVEIGRTPETTFVVADVAQGDHWYQVRAVDAAGNEGFKTFPIQVTIDRPDVDTTPPSTPRDLAGTVNADGDIELTWTASTDNVGVVDYLVYRNNVVIDTVTEPNAVFVDPPIGNNWMQVRARDAAGNEGFKTFPIQITVEDNPDPGVDTTPPTTPRDLAGVQNADDDVELTWTASTDNVGVAEYRILRNGTEIGRSPTAGFLVVDPPAGTSWFQIQALDAAGNESFRTSPLEFEVLEAPGVDTTPPRTPRNLQGAIDVDTSTATLTWEASTDAVGVTEYVVLRNGVEVLTVDGATLTATTPASPGGNWYQIQALDAAGNRSFRTSPLELRL